MLFNLVPSGGARGAQKIGGKMSKTCKITNRIKLLLLFIIIINYNLSCVLLRSHDAIFVLMSLKSENITNSIPSKRPVTLDYMLVFTFHTMKPGGFKSHKVYKKKKEEGGPLGNQPNRRQFAWCEWPALHHVALLLQPSQGSVIGFGNRMQDTDNADNVFKVPRKKVTGNECSKRKNVFMYLSTNYSEWVFWNNLNVKGLFVIILRGKHKEHRIYIKWNCALYNCRALINFFFFFLKYK